MGVSVIGTSSVRRVAQLRKAYPLLKFADVVSETYSILTAFPHSSSLRSEGISKRDSANSTTPPQPTPPSSSLPPASSDSVKEIESPLPSLPPFSSTPSVKELSVSKFGTMIREREILSGHWKIGKRGGRRDARGVC